jgi:ribulose-phosphate 3-epimerase
MNKRCLCPSILSADFARLADSIGRVEGNCEMLHLDVMDGHFVPNITIGPPVVKAISKVSGLPLDCHLMIENPDRYLKDFASAGTTYLSVHQETCPHLHRTVQAIRDEGMKPGVAINPSTPANALEMILPDLDFVLVMSVNPGFGGQSFIPVSLDKVRDLRRRIDELGLETAIQVDGGVCEETLPGLLEAGADWFVAGSAVFGAPDPAAAAGRLQEIMRG